LKSILKYLIILPLVLFNFSCDETVTDSTIYNGDLVGSWMLTNLTGTYTYTVALPDDSWAADTSFGIKARWDGADALFIGALVGYSEYGNLWLSEVKEESIIPGVSTEKIFTLADLQAETIGLIGVFEDAPSAGAYATYKMKGVYPSVGYNYGACTTALDKPDMGDQGIYTWDQTTYNFTIKRDPDIGGSQVLPAFDDGMLTFTDETMNTINIKFLDRDAHSTRFIEIPDQSWNEGAHPSVNGINSGGDRSYMAFPPVVAVGNMGYGDTFIGAYDPDSPTHNSPGIGPAYVYNPVLAPWGNYMTFYAWCFTAEMNALAAVEVLTDAASDGSMADDLVGYMLTALGDDATSSTQGIGMPYASLVSMGDDGQTPTITDDSDHDLETDLTLGGRMKYTIIHNDCAVPADVTIDFNTTFTRCTTDNCTGDNYHIEPDWD